LWGEININEEKMNNEEKIKKLQAEIESLKRSQFNCSHTWDDVKYDPEEVTVQDTGAGYEIHGSDMWPILSFHKECKNRWSRECIKCGFKQYTNKIEVVSVKSEPKF